MRGAVESPGNYWVRLYGAPEECGIRVVLTNPLKTKAIAKVRIKTDKRVLQLWLTC